MKTRLLLALLAPCLLAAGAALAAPPEWTGNFNVALGSKMLEDDWEPVDDQTSFGFLLDFRRPEWPANLAVDLLFSWADEDETVFIPGTGVVNVDVKGNTTELNLGARKHWEGVTGVSSLTPYAGGGLALVWAEHEADGPSVDEGEDGVGVGLWAGVGAYFTLLEHLNLGADLRYSHTTNVDLIGGENGNAGGLRASFFAGYHW